MELEAIAAGHHYTTPAYPFVIALLGLVACAGAAAWAHVRTSAREPARSAAAAVAFGVTALGFVAAELGGLVAALGGSQAAAALGSGEAARSAFGLFPRACWLAGVTSGLAGLVVIVIGTMLLARASDRARSRAPYAMAVACGWVAAQVGSAQMVLLALAGGFPVFSARPHPFAVQRGRSFEVESALASGSDLEGYAITTTVATEVEGPARVIEEARRPLLSIRREVAIDAFEELGPPHFELRVGNRWRYRFEHVSRDTAIFGAVTTHLDEGSEIVTMEVAGAEVVRGVRVFTVVTRREQEGTAPATTRLYARDGALHHMLGDAPRATDPALALPSPDDRGTPYDLPMLASQCRGTAPISETTAIGGACLCEVRRGSSAGDLIIAILTLGLASPGSQRDRSWRLLESRRGEGEAAPVDGVLPAAAPAGPCPPAPEPVSCAQAERWGVGLSRRARRRFERAGVAVDLASRPSHVRLTGTVAQLAEALGMEARFAEQVGDCPNDRVCLPSLEGPLARELERDLFSRGITLAFGACTPAAPP